MAGAYGWNYTKRYYDRLLWLSYSGWAWEFRRRLPGLLGERRAAKSKPAWLRRPDGVQLIRMRTPCRLAERHGLHFLPDPRLSAYQTPVFWLPEIMSGNIDAAATLQSHLADSTEQLSWHSVPGKKAVLIAPGRRTKLSIAARGYAAQLAIDTSRAPVPLAIYLTLKLQSGSKLLEQLKCLDWFAHHCAGIKFDAAPKRGYAPTKLRDCLIALDGWLSGATQREIGSAIFGADTITEDWDKGVLAYKSRTRRLIQKGRRLMESEYLNLL
ncbi:MAG: DUF2285 domain-containing protein [Pseudomonadota bacterium]